VVKTAPDILRHGLLAPCVRPVLALALLLTAGCAPSLHYDVDLREARAGEVAVRMRLRGAPRDSLVLRGYGTTAELRLHGVEVDAPGSAGFAIDSMPSGGALAPRLVIQGPVPATVTVRYRVTPGGREGDAHTGWTGRSFGDISQHGMFATGRGLFLFPAGTGRIERIRVRFELPAGWDVVVPWMRDEGAWKPGVSRRFAPEDLLFGSLGLGAFEVRSVRVGGTEFRLAFDRRIDRAERRRTAVALERVIHIVHDAFGRGLGERYTVVVMPETVAGDAIAGDGWASGQGGTLAPITGTRLHEFARRLIDAYVVHAPFRVTAHDTKEQWALDGICELLAWRAVARAGLADEAQVERDLASAYAEALDRDEAAESLEQPSGDPNRAGMIAPLALLCLERALAREDGGEPARGSGAAPRAGSAAASGAGRFDGRLDVLIRAMFAGTAQVAERAIGIPTPAHSLWASIPAPQRAAARAFRERYIAGTEPLPVESFFGLAAPTTDPMPSRGPATHALVFAFSGNTQGYLENCGCKAGQAGGVARRATVLARLRTVGARRVPVLAIDAGSTFPRGGRRFGADTLAALEQQLYLATLRAMRFDAAVIGETELAQAPALFRREAAASAVPWVLGNVRRDHVLLALPARVVRVGGLRVGIAGLFDPPRGVNLNPDYERNAVTLGFEDPIEVMRRQLPQLRAQADLVVAAGRIDPVTIRRLIAACPDLDVVISTVDRAVRRTAGDGDSEIADADPPGFIGQTLVLYATLDSYGLGSATLGLDATNRIATADIAATWLGDKIPDEPAIRAMLTRFYERVGASPAAQASVPALFLNDPGRRAGKYVGVANCIGCHAAETAQWKRTRHADAWKTLLDVHRHYQPRCVACHVVGFGTPSGYHIGNSDEKLVNVQCEMCHGPGGEHVLAPVRGNIRKAVPVEVCRECHTADHSDHFVYADRLPRVTHHVPVAGRDSLR